MSATLYSCIYIWRDWGTKTTGSFENPLSISSNGFLWEAFIQSHMYPQCFGHTDPAPRFQLKTERHSLSRSSLCWLPPLALGSSTCTAFATTILQHTNLFCNRILLSGVSRRSQITLHNLYACGVKYGGHSLKFGPRRLQYFQSYFLGPKQRLHSCQKWFDQLDLFLF